MQLPDLHYDIRQRQIPSYLQHSQIVFIYPVVSSGSVKTIGQGSFCHCYSLETLTISEGVEFIGPSAFADQNLLTEINIPSSVTFIDDDAFDSATITSFNVAASNNNYVSVDGVLYNKAMTTLEIFPGGKNVEEFTIPYSVTTIGDFAFANCRNYLTSVTIPSGVTSMPLHGFSYCWALTKMIFMGNAPTSFGENWIFGHNPELIVYFYNGVSGFDTPTWNAGSFVLNTVCNYPSTDFEYRFINGGSEIEIITWHGSGVSNIPSLIDGKPVTSIAMNAYLGGPITYVSIPSSVNFIGQTAFAQIESLTAIDVSPDNPIFASFDGVVYDKAMTTLIQYPGGKTGAFHVPEGVLTIGDWAFGTHTYLTMITIPESVTNIGNHAFCNMASRPYSCLPTLPSWLPFHNDPNVL